jgi:hypothetical protein
MATWSVKPVWKKSIIERQYFEKDGDIIMHETGWRWGEFHVYTDDDEPPKLEPGVDMYDCGYESEMIETNDGCWEETNYDDCDDDVAEEVQAFLEDNSVYDLEELGWIPTDCEMIIDCDMTIEKVDE